MICNTCRIVLLVLAIVTTVSSGANAAPAARPFHRAWWIWDVLGASQEAQSTAPRYFRRTFEIPANPKAAELHVTADNEYTVYLNGEKIGGNGEWQSIEVFQLAKQLKRGTNVLASSSVSTTSCKPFW